MSQQEEYSEEVQKVLISFMISDKDAFALSQNIIKDEYFDSRLKPAVRYILDYATEYRALPTPEQIKASTTTNIEKFSELAPQHTEWYLKTIEEFCRHKALENTILNGMDLLTKGEGAKLETLVKEAMTISLLKDLGTSYFENPLERLQRMRDRSNYITTGWKVLDRKLYGGFTPGALNVFAGGSGSGKSLFLQNIGLNWAMMGMNVIYFSLELSEDLVSMRIDAMTSGLSTKEIFKRMQDVDLKVRMKGRNAGDFRIKKMPEAGTTANDLRAFLKEYEIQTGRRPDAVIIDYLDLMHPNNRKINPSDLFVKDKYTSEEMRALASDYQCLCVTASQLNRQSVEAQEFDHSHIAGGISKINTADNVFGIFASMHMKERGVYQLQFLKTRSSSAVGQKIELKFDPETLLISDPDEEQEEQQSKTADQLREELKAKMATKVEVPNGQAVANTVQAAQSSPIRKDVMSLMGKIRSQTDL